MPTSNTKNTTNHFPINEVEFNKWFTQFNKTFTTYATKFNFTPVQIKAFKNAYNNWNKYYQAFQKAQIAANKASINVTTSRKSAETLMNSFWYRIGNSTSNTGQFTTLGIPAKTKTKTKSTTSKASTSSKRRVTGKKVTTTKSSTSPRATAKTIKPVTKKTVSTAKVTKSIVRKPVSNSITKSTSKTTKPVSSMRTVTHNESPFVRVDSSVRGKIQVYVSSNENGTGKFPTWSNGVTLQFRTKSGRWQTLPVSNTNWPFTHVVGNAKTGPFQYRAAYTFGKGKFGPWSNASFGVSKAA